MSEIQYKGELYARKITNLRKMSAELDGLG